MFLNLPVHPQDDDGEESQASATTAVKQATNLSRRVTSPINRGEDLGFDSANVSLPCPIMSPHTVNLIYLLYSNVKGVWWGCKVSLRFLRRIHISS